METWWQFHIHLHTIPLARDLKHKCKEDSGAEDKNNIKIHKVNQHHQALCHFLNPVSHALKHKHSAQVVHVPKVTLIFR